MQKNVPFVVVSAHFAFYCVQDGKRALERIAEQPCGLRLARTLVSMSTHSSSASDAGEANDALGAFLHGLPDGEMMEIWACLPRAEQCAALRALGDALVDNLPIGMERRLNDVREAHDDAAAAAEGERFCALGSPAIRALSGRVLVRRSADDDRTLRTLGRVVVYVDGQMAVFYKHVEPFAISTLRALHTWSIGGVSRAEWRRAARGYLDAYVIAHASDWNAESDLAEASSASCNLDDDALKTEPSTGSDSGDDYLYRRTRRAIRADLRDELDKQAVARSFAHRRPAKRSTSDSDGAPPAKRPCS